MKSHGKKVIKKKKTFWQRTRIFLRRHFFNKRAVEGSVTIFLIIIMLPMLIFSCSVVDLCKIFMAKNTTQSALELTMNARLASYDDILKDMYGILASSADESELSKKLTEYYKMTLESSTGVVMDGDDKKYIENLFDSIFQQNTDAMNSAVKDTNGYMYLFENNISGGSSSFAVTPVATSSVTNPAVMQRQIVDYMKYRGPVYMVTGLLDKFTAFSDVSNQVKAAEKQLEYEQKLNDTGESFNATYELFKKFMNNSIELENLKGDIDTTYHYSSFVSGSTVKVPDELLDYIKNWCVPFIFVISYFGEALLVYNHEGELHYKESVDEAFKSNDPEKTANISNAADKLRDALREVKAVESEISTVAPIYGTAVNNPQSINDFINSAARNNRFEIEMLDKFGQLFEGFTHHNSSDSDVLIDFLEAYEDARKTANHHDARITDYKKNPTESNMKRADELDKELQDIKKAIDEAEEYKDMIKIIADNIRYFYGSGESGYTQNKSIYSSADSAYNLALGGMYSDDWGDVDRLYSIVVTQIKNLEDLLTGENSIGKVQDKLKELSASADAYNTAVGGVKEESTKAEMQANYNAGAAKIKEITVDDTALKTLEDLLTNILNQYKEVKKVLESIKLFEIPPINTSSKQVVDFPTFLKSICANHPNDTIYYDFKSFNINDPMYFKVDTGSISGENIGKWDKKNSDIEKNALYQTIKKYGTAEDKKADENAKAKAEEYKGTIDKMASDTSGQSKPASADDAKKNSETDDTKDEDLWFVPKRYPIYNDYVDDLQNAYNSQKVSGFTDDILKGLDDNSFKTEPANPDSADGGITGVDGDPGSAAGALNLLKSIGTFFDNLLKAARDDLYMAEYLTENFPCVTTLQGDKDASTISGEKFMKDGKATVVCSHSSLEYILYGNMNSNSELEALASVAKASAVLFGVRFALNLIYALTSPTLLAWVEPIVAPLEVIPFAAPLARTVILIGLALGESAIDIALLLLNQKVALFKNDTTWICSPMGLANAGSALLDLAMDKAPELIDKAGDAIVSKLTEAEDELAKKLTEGVDSAEAEVNAYAEEVTKTLANEIENAVWSPIYSVIKDAVNDFDLGENVGEDKIENKLKKALDDAEKSLGLFNGTSQGDIVKEIEEEMFTYMESQTGYIAGVIHDELSNFSDSIKTSIVKGVESFNNKVKGAISDVQQKVNGYFTDATGKLSKKVKDEITDLAKDFKEKTKDTGEKAKDYLKKGVNEKLKGLKSSSGSISLEKDGSGGTDSGNSLLTKKDTDSPKKSDKTFTVSYQDYMYIFTLIGLMINKNGMLNRTAQLMNANIEVKMTGSVRSDKLDNAYSSTATYNMNKAYTLFKGEAGSKTRTMFFGTTWDKQNQKWVAPASNVYEFTANTYVGY